MRRKYKVGDKVQILDTWLAHLAEGPHSENNSYVRRGLYYEYTIANNRDNYVLKESPFGFWEEKYLVPAGTYQECVEVSCDGIEALL